MKKCKVQRFKKVKSALQTGKERSRGMQISAIVIVSFIIIVVGGIGVILSIHKKNRGTTMIKTNLGNNQKMTVTDAQSETKSNCTKKETIEILETIEALAEIYKNDI